MYLSVYSPFEIFTRLVAVLWHVANYRLVNSGHNDPFCGYLHHESKFSRSFSYYSPIQGLQDPSQLQANPDPNRDKSCIFFSQKPVQSPDKIAYISGQEAVTTENLRYIFLKLSSSLSIPERVSSLSGIQFGGEYLNRKRKIETLGG